MNSKLANTSVCFGKFPANIQSHVDICTFIVSQFDKNKIFLHFKMHMQSCSYVLLMFHKDT